MYVANTSIQTVVKGYYSSSTTKEYKYYALAIASRQARLPGLLPNLSTPVIIGVNLFRPLLPNLSTPVIIGVILVSILPPHTLPCDQITDTFRLNTQTQCYTF